MDVTSQKKAPEKASEYELIKVFSKLFKNYFSIGAEIVSASDVTPTVRWLDV